MSTTEYYYRLLSIKSPKNSNILLSLVGERTLKKCWKNAYLFDKEWQNEPDYFIGSSVFDPTISRNQINMESLSRMHYYLSAFVRTIIIQCYSGIFLATLSFAFWVDSSDVAAWMETDSQTGPMLPMTNLTKCNLCVL